MPGAIILTMLLSSAPAEQTTLPRRPDPDLAEQNARTGTPTDPLFDRAYVATDDPAFILTAVETGRQASLEARQAGQELQSAPLRDAAGRIEKQNEATNRKLIELAQRKGWRLPEANPARQASPGTAGAARANANFILNQIAFHENTLAQFRAQIDGKGDADLRRALREAVPGYQKNLELLLTLKP